MECQPSWHHFVPAGAYNDYVCVDGLQRITAMIRLHVNDLKTYPEVLQWYIEMNAGGTPHTNEEIARVQQLLDIEKKKNY